MCHQLKSCLGVKYSDMFNHSLLGMPWDWFNLHRITQVAFNQQRLLQCFPCSMRFLGINQKCFIYTWIGMVKSALFSFDYTIYVPVNVNQPRVSPSSVGFLFPPVASTFWTANAFISAQVMWSLEPINADELVAILFQAIPPNSSDSGSTGEETGSPLNAIGQW